MSRPQRPHNNGVTTGMSDVPGDDCRAGVLGVESLGTKTRNAGRAFKSGWNPGSMDKEAIPFKKRGLERLEELARGIRLWEGTVGDPGSAFAYDDNRGRLTTAISDTDVRPVVVWLEFIGQAAIAARLEREFEKMKEFVRELDESFVRQAEGVATADDLFRICDCTYEGSYLAANLAYLVKLVRYFLAGEDSGQQEPKPPARPRRPRVGAEGDKLILVGALSSHHKFRSGKPNLEAASQKELERLTQWGQSKVSREMKKLFGKEPMTKYKRLCRREELIKGFLEKHEDGSISIEAIAEN